jgi:hypothetical protein
VDSCISLNRPEDFAPNSALNPDVVRAIRAAERECNATLQKSIWYSDHSAVIGVFLAARRGHCKIEHDLERLPVCLGGGSVLPVSWYNRGVCCSHTRNRRRDFPPPDHLSPEKSCAGENDGRCSNMQHESAAPVRPRCRSKPIEVRKTFAAAAEMFNPRINFSNRDLMARHTLHKLQVGTPDSIRVRESFYQLSIEKFRELSVLVVLSFLMQKANQDSPFPRL